jgi:hypothetical protein
MFENPERSLVPAKERQEGSSSGLRNSEVGEVGDQRVDLIVASKLVDQEGCC